MAEEKKNVLIIGGNSKIGQVFIRNYSKSYNVYATFNNTKPTGISEEKLYNLDLGSSKSVQLFIDNIKNITFKAVIFLASTIGQDKDNYDDFFNQTTGDMKINVVSPLFIAKNINYGPGLGRTIFFGDSGRLHPRQKMTSYNIYKNILEEIVTSLGVELSSKSIVLGIDLGPTMPDLSVEDEEKYYAKNLIQVGNPTLGLVNLLDFIISEDNLNMTSTFIKYDGGTYLKRVN